MKMIRNISQHEGSGTKNQFIEFIGDIADAVQRADSPNFVVECVGILGNLTIPDLDFDRLLEEYNMVPWIKERLRQAKIIFFLNRNSPIGSLPLTKIQNGNTTYSNSEK